nr:hypothetical protein CFP56_52462 [Quercus suber]
MWLSEEASRADLDETYNEHCKDLMNRGLRCQISERSNTGLEECQASCSECSLRVAARKPLHCDEQHLGVTARRSLPILGFHDRHGAGGKARPLAESLIIPKSVATPGDYSRASVPFFLPLALLSSALEHGGLEVAPSGNIPEVYAPEAEEGSKEVVPGSGAPLERRKSNDAAEVMHPGQYEQQQPYPEESTAAPYYAPDSKAQFVGAGATEKMESVNSKPQ